LSLNIDVNEAASHKIANSCKCWQWKMRKLAEKSIIYYAIVDVAN